MKIVDNGNSQTQAIFDRDELLIINAALNEVCNGIEIFEFETRIGADRERVFDLLRQIGPLLDTIDRSV